MYFEKPGFENTEKTIELAVKTANERGIKNIVFASSSGRTAEMIPNEPDINFVAVTLAYGYSAPNESRISQEKLDELHARGIKTYTGTHALSGVERAIDTKFKGLCEVCLLYTSICHPEKLLSVLCIIWILLGGASEICL